MARKYVKRNAVTNGKFDELEKAKAEFNETNDCAVKAVSVACGVTYAEAHAALKKHGRKDRDGTSETTIRKALRDLGFFAKSDWKFTRDLFTKLIRDYNYVTKSLTTRQLTMFPELLEGHEDGTWLIFTASHVLALKDGELHCWGATRALRIIYAYRVTKT